MAAKKCDCGCGETPGNVSRNRKVECESCGYTMRITRTWLAQGLPTCACGNSLMPVCLYDADIAGVEADHPRYAAMSARSTGDTRDFKTDRWSRWWCGQCGAFVSGLDATCSKCRHTSRSYGGTHPHIFAETPDHISVSADRRAANKRRAAASPSRYKSRGRRKPAANPDVPF